MIYIGMINYNKHLSIALQVQHASKLNVHKNFKTAVYLVKRLLTIEEQEIGHNSDRRF